MMLCIGCFPSCRRCKRCSVQKRKQARAVKPWVWAIEYFTDVVRRKGLGSASPPQDASHGAPDDGATDRAAYFAADRLPKVAGNLARHAVADRTGHFPRDQLPGRKPCPACAIGAKYAAEHGADTAQPPRQRRREAGFLPRRLGNAVQRSARPQGRIVDAFARPRRQISESIAWSYLPLIGLLAINVLRSSGAIGPSRAEGGRTMQRCTMEGVPLPSRKETNASPLPSSMMTLAVLSLGLGRNVSAAAFTAF